MIPVVILGRTLCTLPAGDFEGVDSIEIEGGVVLHRRPLRMIVHVFVEDPSPMVPLDADVATAAFMLAAHLNPQRAL